ncbi:MAG: RING finger protein [Candidatus Pacebacteria bacterium]|nr:RING finger protein [Candidatus Paceibacterota bacterium]
MEEPFLFRLKYSGDLVGKDDECLICMQRFVSGDVLIYLPCYEYHHFHEKCICAWMRRNSSCPICKKDITEQFLAETPISLQAIRDRLRATSDKSPSAMNP